jgi:hypothetical protein
MFRSKKAYIYCYSYSEVGELVGEHPNNLVYPEISNWLEILFSQGEGVGELENILYILKSTEKTLN